MRKADCSTARKTERVWAEFHEKLLSFIRKRVNGDAVANDVLQDVFVKIHKNIDTIRQGQKLESWVYQIARNTIIDHYRTRREHVELPEWLALPEPDDEQEGHGEISVCLASLIEQLPEKYRRAVRLCDVEGWSQKEVAQLENLTVSGAKSRIQRGRIQLKELLHDCCQCTSMSRNEFIDCASDGCDCGKC